MAPARRPNTSRVTAQNLIKSHHVISSRKSHHVKISSNVLLRRTLRCIRKLEDLACAMRRVARKEQQLCGHVPLHHVRNSKGAAHDLEVGYPRRWSSGTGFGGSRRPSS